MLILDDIIRAAKIQCSYGERGPGHITHDDRRLKGPNLQILPNQKAGELKENEDTRSTSVSSTIINSSEMLEISISVGFDDETQEYRAIVE